MALSISCHASQELDHLEAQAIKTYLNSTLGSRVMSYTQQVREKIHHYTLNIDTDARLRDVHELVSTLTKKYNLIIHDTTDIHS